MVKRGLGLILTVLICISQMGLSYADSFFEDEQMPTFEKIGRDDGLLDLSVSNIVQDKYGFIWFATQGGLFKYNGKDTVVYRNNPFEMTGLIHNLIQTVYYDEASNELWLGTYQGISRFDVDDEIFTNYGVESTGLSNNVIVAIAKDVKGRMWFGTMDGLNLLDEETGKFITYPIEGKVVRSLLSDSHGRLLVGTYEGLWMMDETSDSFKKVDIDLPQPYVMTIDEFERDHFTFGIWDGGIVETDESFNIQSQVTFEDNRVYAVEKTRDQTLWAGTWGGGLFSIKDGQIHHFPGEGKKGDIGHNIIYSFEEDDSGILWIGTNGGGVYKTNPRKVSYLLFQNDPDDPDSLDAGKINSIYKDHMGRLWIAVYNKGLNRWSNSEKKMLKYTSDKEGQQSIPNDQVMKLIEYDGELYAATGMGIARYDEETDCFVPANILPEETITYALAEDRDGHLWVGTYLDGVYEFDKTFKLLNHFNSKNEQKPLSDDLIYDILCDSQNRIWIGTNNGLNVYNKETGVIKAYHKEDGNYAALSSNTARAVIESHDGTIWVGLVGGGISRYIEEADAFISYTETEGLVDNSVISIKESADYRLWVATHNGMSILDPATNKIVNLSLSDGIGGYLFTGDGYVDRDGTVYFGGTHGITRFPPTANIETDTLPKVYITEMNLFGKAIESGTDIYNDRIFSLDFDDNYISFGFNALDYETLSQIQYSYMLTGVDGEWVESGNRNFASYSNLKPGKYMFSVRIKSIQGEYTDPVTVSFEIKRPWFKSWYAYLAYLILIAGILYGLVKIREGQMISRQNSELEKINEKLEEAVKELEAVSIKDALTGIYNRRYFDMVLRDYLQLAKRSKDNISLMMIDVDDFKQINDVYGHVFGDKFLKGIAKQIKEVIPRSTDFCARFGGDEFVVVLYDTDKAGASKVAERIFNNLQTIRVEGESGIKEVSISVSIGVYSAVPDREISIDQFVSNADEALYEAKRTGKNKVAVR